MFPNFLKHLNFYKASTLWLKLEVGKFWPRPLDLVNKALMDHSSIYLCTVYGCLCTTTAELTELNSCYRLYGPLSLKYLLFNLLQEKFAAPSLNSSSEFNQQLHITVNWNQSLQLHWPNTTANTHFKQLVWFAMYLKYIPDFKT